MSLPERKNIRAKFHNYSGGVYFVTICTAEKEHFFGRIENGMMHFTDIGEYADSELKSLSSHYPYVEIPLYVVMPNHIHAIVVINDTDGADAPRCIPTDGADAPRCSHTDGADAPRCIPTERTALGVVIGGYKQAITRFARRNNIKFDWQKRFHDHIIRGNSDANKITDYIKNNVSRWDSDCFYSD